VSFLDFQATRHQANKAGAATWTLPKNVANYGIAHLGPIGDDLVPVVLATSVNKEVPEIQPGEGGRPAPVTMTVTVTLTELDPSESYVLYKYDSEGDVPNSEFNANRAQAVAEWAVSGEESGWSREEEMSSDEKVFFRCVLETAP